MYYINYNDAGRVQIIITGPYPEQIEDDGLLVEALPVASTPEGMYPTMMVNLETKELYYNYEDLPDPDNTLSDKVVALERADIENKQAIADLTMTMAMMMI